MFITSNPKSLFYPISLLPSLPLFSPLTKWWIIKIIKIKSKMTIFHYKMNIFKWKMNIFQRKTTIFIWVCSNIKSPNPNFSKYSWNDYLQIKKYHLQPPNTEIFKHFSVFGISNLEALITNNFYFLVDFIRPTWSPWSPGTQDYLNSYWSKSAG